jgi:hypothetical protein
MQPFTFNFLKPNTKWMSSFTQLNKKLRVSISYLSILMLCIVLTGNAVAQKNKPLKITLLGQGNFGVYDETLSNNSGGIGLGLNIAYHLKGKVHPLLELNGDLFAGTKEAIVNQDGRIYESKSQMGSIYAGPQFQLSKRFFASTTAGVSFFNDNAHLGIRPSLGYQFTPNGHWLLKTSFTHIFKAEAISENPFGYLSLAIGFRF